MRATEARAIESYRRVFGAEPSVIASAPGRVNLIGEHTDYNDGFVLPIAIDRRVAVALGGGRGAFYSDDYAETRPEELVRDGSWADYPRAVEWAIRQAGSPRLKLAMAFAGDVPQGAGLSSSAAIEAATAVARDAISELGMGRVELAEICRLGENEFVGVQSGIMDQFVALLGEAERALFLDCRSLEYELIPFRLAEAGLDLLVCNTGRDRALGESGYNERRATCERAARMLGLRSLRDAGMSDLQRLNGNELKRARHVLTENERVLRAVEALKTDDFEIFGRLMYESHASLRDDYEVSTPALDAFVESMRTAGALGARLTGAGFGGCGVALVREDCVESAMESASQALSQAGLTSVEFYRFSASEGASVCAP